MKKLCASSFGCQTEEDQVMRMHNGGERAVSSDSWAKTREKLTLEAGAGASAGRGGGGREEMTLLTAYSSLCC